MTAAWPPSVLGPFRVAACVRVQVKSNAPTQASPAPPKALPQRRKPTVGPLFRQAPPDPVQAGPGGACRVRDLNSIQLVRFCKHARQGGATIVRETLPGPPV
jgi:hypothetical protein